MTQVHSPEWHRRPLETRSWCRSVRAGGHDCVRERDGVHDDPSWKALGPAAWCQDDSSATSAPAVGGDDDRERGPACCESWCWRSTTRTRRIYQN